MQEISGTIRALPGYQAGVRHGIDIGLVVALTAITAEMQRQTDAATGVQQAPP
jgi:hypothetical protein